VPYSVGIRLILGEPRRRYDIRRSAHRPDRQADAGLVQGLVDQLGEFDRLFR
jgi:hypothetical protein